MVKARHRVQLATYNGHLGQGMSAKNPDLSEWLIPTLRRSMEEDKRRSKEKGEKEEGGEAPDFVAIGFQEMIPLHSSLLGLTKFAIDLHDAKLKQVIESNLAPSPHTRSSTQSTQETYTLLSKAVLGGIVLLVYARDKTVTKAVVEVRVARAACGIFRVMGNKGAVGVRVTIDENPRAGLEQGEDSEDEEEDDEEDGSEISSLVKKSSKRGGKKERSVLPPEVFTFVTTHLAAHDHGLARRAEDYESIVSRLIFTPTSLSPHFPLPPFLPSSIQSAQMYDTSYLFFFGDLNYRINIKEPKSLALHVLSHKIINEGEELLKHDTLRQEQEKGRTLQGLKEGVITFRPTYKYKPGTISEFKKFTKRVPGWCDRILYATWADGVSGAGLIKKSTTKSSSKLDVKRRGRGGDEDNYDEGGRGGKELVEKKRKGVKVEFYKSIMEFTGSDHKPVTAIISLPRQPKPSRKSGPAKELRLVLQSPYPVDQSWRRKQVVGVMLDRLVGFWWSIFMLLGFGKNAGFGFGNFSAMAFAIWYYQEHLRQFIA